MLKTLRLFGLMAALAVAVSSAPAQAEDALLQQASVKATPSTEVAEETKADAAEPKKGNKVLGMVTGTRTGTYYRFGSDIRDIVKKAGIDLDVKESSGSIDNINRIASKENAAFGIVQSDVLGFMQRSKDKEDSEAKKIAENLRMIFPLYSEEIHVLAHKSVKNFNDLGGKTVVVGPKGSGTWLTSVNLFNIANVQPGKMLRMSPEEGMVAVLSGKADAMIYVGGKPVKLFENLDSLAENSSYGEMLKNVHLVPMNDPVMLKEYGTTIITPKDYSFVKEDVPTLSVTAVLVSYGFANADSAFAKKRCDDIGNFSKAMADEIAALKRAGHVKWKEVDLDAEVSFWKRDKCAVTGTETIAATPLENELLETLSNTQ